MLLTLVEKMVDQYFAVIPRKTPKAEKTSQALIIAHRGAHNNKQGIIENTHSAFRLAQESGCWGIEFDVHATADGVLVVNHDPTLNRLWGENVAISDITFNTLRSIAPDVPSLEEVVREYAGTMHLFIELKYPFRNEGALISVLGHLTPCKDFHFLSLDSRIFATFTHFTSESFLLVAVHNNVKEFCDLSIKKHYGGVLGNYLLVHSKRVRQLNEAQQLFGVGFVDSRNSLYRELNRGVKWLFTNKASDINVHMKRLQERHYGTLMS